MRMAQLVGGKKTQERYISSVIPFQHCACHMCTLYAHESAAHEWYLHVCPLPRFFPLWKQRDTTGFATIFLLMVAKSTTPDWERKGIKVRPFLSSVNCLLFLHHRLSSLLRPFTSTSSASSLFHSFITSFIHSHQHLLLPLSSDSPQVLIHSTTQPLPVSDGVQ
jgi:hypothetical protein